jgi:hypothetical protein
LNLIKYDIDVITLEISNSCLLIDKLLELNYLAIPLLFSYDIVFLSPSTVSKMALPPHCDCPQAKSMQCNGKVISTNGICLDGVARNKKISHIKSCKYPDKYWAPGMKWGMN